jgi:hypothetical protein
MASTAEAGMSAGSNLVSGAGATVATFTLPASPLYRVESVVAHVDNTAGGDTTATLTYADTNGEVIAKRPQGDVIPAGDTGTATFALRLTGTKRGFIRYNKLNVGDWLSIQATGTGGLFGGSIEMIAAALMELIATDIALQPGNDIILTAGRDITMQVSRNLDATVTTDTTISTQDFTIRLTAAAKSVTVRDRFNAPIFRIDENGDLHGKTGKALVFDL